MRTRGTLLIRVYALSPMLPLILIAVDQVNALSVTAVALWGLGMSVVTSFSMPAQQAILNRVSGAALQQGVSASTAVGFLVQMGGLMLAGQMDRIGLSAVLLVQAVCLAVGGACHPPHLGGAAAGRGGSERTGAEDHCRRISRDARKPGDFPDPDD